MKTVKKIAFYTSIFLFIFLLCVLNNNADRDLWHRLAVGSIFFNTGSVLKHDIFAYTQTKLLWIDHEWLTGVVVYFISNHFGDIGLTLLKILAYFTVVITIRQTHRLISGKADCYHIGYYLVTILALFTGFVTTVRSQIFTYVFFALWIYILERIRRGEKGLIWIFPATMLLWANLHGGFIAGLGLLLIYALSEFLNKNNPAKYMKIFVITLPATLVNPYFLDYWHFIIQAVTMPRPHILEWKPLYYFINNADLIGLKLIFLITIIGFSYKFLIKKAKIDWLEVILLCTTMFLAVKHMRHVVFFVISASIFSYPYFYEAKEKTFKKLSEKFNNYFTKNQVNLINFTKGTTIYAVIIALSLHCISKTPIKLDISDKYYPVKAIEYIKANNLSGNLLVSFNWGSYALWKLYPQCKVSLDGRYEEVYTDETYQEVTDFAFFLNKWDRILKNYKNDIILIEKNSDTYKSLTKMKEWKLVYQDKTSALFKR